MVRPRRGRAGHDQGRHRSARRRPLPISFNANGEYFEVGGVYREVVPNARLVFTWAWHSTPERELLVNISIKPEGSGTLLTFKHEQFADTIARDNHERGWNEFFAKLESYLD